MPHDPDSSLCRFGDCQRPHEPYDPAAATGGLEFCEDHDRLIRRRLGFQRSAAALLGSGDTTSWVYFATDGRRVKIGTSKLVLGRMIGLRTRPLVIEPGGRRHEGKLHAQFFPYRLTGEWFRPAHPLLEYIYEARQRRDSTPVALIEDEASVIHVGMEIRHRFPKCAGGTRKIRSVWVGPVGSATCVECRSLFRWEPQYGEVSQAVEMGSR